MRLTRKATVHISGLCERSLSPASWAGFAPFMYGPIPTGCCDHEQRRNWISTKSAACPIVRDRTRSIRSVCSGADWCVACGEAWVNGSPAGRSPAITRRSWSSRTAHGHAHAQRLRLFSASELVPWGNKTVATPKLSGRRFGNRFWTVLATKRRQGRDAYRRHARKRHPRP
jgi:hypothetical protein